MKLGKFSIGMGDRFTHQAKAQLRACILAEQKGIEVIPVWNKSNREHLIIGSHPAATRAAADKAVRELEWRHPYYCDADHINLDTVDRYLNSCDFYTIDVADYIGRPAEASAIETFVESHKELIRHVHLEGIEQSFDVTREFLTKTASKFLYAVQEAGKVYRKIEAVRGKNNFIAEISMDETDTAQTPAELLIILAAIASEEVHVQTVAPKFTGRFNKGVDYVGDVAQFSREIELDVAAIAWAITNYGLPDNLKLSIHSGSDKFSIYSSIHQVIKQYDVGVHLKTAGTTWLEELIGLAEADGAALALAKHIYAEAYRHREELCAPYASVIEVEVDSLPLPSAVDAWSSNQYTSALRHNSNSPSYNSSLRQLLHVGFKVAAQMGGDYVALLDAHEDVIGRNVTDNLYRRHIGPVFLGNTSLTSTII